MKRFASITPLFAVLAVFSGCAASSETDEASVSPYISQPCAENGCDEPAPPFCAPDDTNCGQPPKQCDESDPGCKVPPIEPDPCPAQEVKADATCDQLLGYAWDGKTCFALNGCECAGADCGSLFKTEEACKQKFASCTGSSGDYCDETAKQLGELLAAARECNAASMGIIVCDGTKVQTTFGCPVPVANGNSDATLKYLEIFSQYAQKCPLPLPACPNTEGVPITCLQGPDQDGLMGTCSFSPGDTAGPAKE